MIPALCKIGLAVALTATLGPATAIAQDATGVLRRATAAMTGSTDLKTLRYAGRGTGASFGQAYVATDPWPKLNYSRYVRQLDYDKVYISEEVMQGRAEPKGGGAVPLTGEAPAVTAANAYRAWNGAGAAAGPRQGAHAARLHNLWITPHGVIKAAMQNKATLDFRTEGGRSLAALSFAVPGVMQATALLNDDFLVERVESRLSDQVLGDIAVITTFADYRDFNGVKFPTRIEQRQAGHMTLSLNVTDVSPNATIDETVPENVAKSSGERVTAEKAAEGVWFIAGGSHHSVAIEMADHVILVEAPLGDERAAAVFAETRKLVPNKPIRYVVNSHNHFDHAGGLRYAASQGASLVVQAQSKAYFERAMANPSRITPDAHSKMGKRAAVVGVGEKAVMRDATRAVEIHHIKDSVHSDAMLLVYLPNERLLVEADLYSPGPPNAPAPTPPNGLHLELVKNVDRLKLAVDRILPLHGRIVPLAELNRMVGK